MNQSSIIVATLLAGFVLYLAAQNRLGVYLSVLWGPTATTPPSATAKSGTTDNLLSQAGSVAETAAILGAF